MPYDSHLPVPDPRRQRELASDYVKVTKAGLDFPHLHAKLLIFDTTPFELVKHRITHHSFQ